MKIEDLVINIAVLGPSFGGVAGVRLVFAKNGPVSPFSAALVVRADKLPDRRSFILAAVLPRTEGDTRRDKGRVRRKLVPNRGRKETTIVVPRIRVAEDEGGFRSPRSILRGSRVGGTSFDLYFTNCRNCNRERAGGGR